MTIMPSSGTDSICTSPLRLSIAGCAPRGDWRRPPILVKRSGRRPGSLPGAFGLLAANGRLPPAGPRPLFAGAACRLRARSVCVAAPFAMPKLSVDFSVRGCGRCRSGNRRPALSFRCILDDRSRCGHRCGPAENCPAAPFQIAPSASRPRPLAEAGAGPPAAGAPSVGAATFPSDF